MNLPFIWYKNLGRTFVRFVTIYGCDGQTDGHVCRRKDHPAYMQRGKKLQQNCKGILILWNRVQVLHYHDISIFKYIHELPQYCKISSSKQHINGPQLYDWTCCIHFEYQANCLQNCNTYPIQTGQSSYHGIPLQHNVTSQFLTVLSIKW